MLRKDNPRRKFTAQKPMELQFWHKNQRTLHVYLRNERVKNECWKQRSHRKLRRKLKEEIERRKLTEKELKNETKKKN